MTEPLTDLQRRMLEQWTTPPTAERAPTLVPVPGKRDRRGRVPRTKRRGHPLADNEGKVYPHRALAWDLWGPGPHRCWQCGATVYWLRQVKGAPVVPCELRVAFVDGDVGNVDAANLRPSCAPCRQR